MQERKREREKGRTGGLEGVWRWGRWGPVSMDERHRNQGRLPGGVDSEGRELFWEMSGGDGLILHKGT